VTNTTTDNNIQARVIEMLKASEPLPSIMQATGLSSGEVGAIAHEARLTHEQVRELTRSYIEALAWGERHNSKKIQALASRARTALNELVHARATESEVAAAEKKAAELRQQLAATENRLRQLKGKPTATRRKPSPASPRPANRPQSEREQIRQWARANGHTVSNMGALPATVIDAYRRAHSERRAAA
jgi:Lsr2 protein